MTRQERKAIVDGIIYDITAGISTTAFDSTPIRLEDLDFTRTDVVDCSKVNVINFRNLGDIRKIDGKFLRIDFGNMVSGFPFSIKDVIFKSSETAYISGIYSKNEPVCIAAQKELIKCNNGLFAKKQFRYWDNEFTQNVRADWEDEGFNIEWMKYNVLCKIRTNENFRNLLLSTPDNSLIVEDTSFQSIKRSSKKLVWGSENSKLLQLKKDKLKELKARLKEYDIPVSKKYKQQLFNNIYNIGEFVGQNLMGKILTYLRICLRNGVEPDIDYDLLNRKGMYLLGQKLVFE